MLTSGSTALVYFNRGTVIARPIGKGEPLESNKNAALRGQFLYVKALEILLNLYGGQYQDGTIAQQANYHPEDIRTVVSIAEHISTHLNQNFSIESLSADFNINRDKLQKVFKSVYGTTLNKYTLNAKLELAHK